VAAWSVRPRSPWLSCSVRRPAQRVFRLTFLQHDCVAKQRFAKRYRHPDLDARLTKARLQGVRLRPTRTRGRASSRGAQEARTLLKARKLGVLAPVLVHVDTTASVLYMQFVPGPAVKQRLFDGLEQTGASRLRPPRARAHAPRLRRAGGAGAEDWTRSGNTARRRRRAR